jgi:hypothetical protein
MSTRILRRLGAAAAGLMIVAGLATPAVAASAAPASMGYTKTPTCVVSASPYSFIETGLGLEASSVAFIITVECKPVYSEQYVELQTPQLNNACQGTLQWYSVSNPLGGAGESFEVRLDDDGNATAVVWGGPSCAATRALITADLTVAPFTTATVKVKIAPPVTTRKGLFAFPAREVEDATTSSVAAIFYAEFPSVQAESTVEISDPQLFDRCAHHLIWVGPNFTILAVNTESVRTTLDDNGNAFVVALAGPSCASGTTLAEADLVGPPYATLTTEFTVLPPRVTV